jgi:multiple antibiotic resistance protein
MNPLALLHEDFLLVLAALLSIINPLGLAFVYREMTRWAAEGERKQLANRIGLYALVVILTSYFVGRYVLAFFGIDLPALRIAGGFVVATSGWQLLNAAIPDPNPTPATPAAMDTAPLMQMAFYPLTMPLTTGPGTIAVCIALGAARTQRYGAEQIYAVIGFLAAALITVLAVVLCYRNAHRLAQAVGPEGESIVKRLSAFLLLCIGVQIMATGFLDLLRPLLAGQA